MAREGVIDRAGRGRIYIGLGVGVVGIGTIVGLGVRRGI